MVPPFFIFIFTLMIVIRVYWACM